MNKLARIWEGIVSESSEMARAASILRHISFQAQVRCSLVQEWLDVTYGRRVPPHTPAAKTPPPPIGPPPTMNEPVLPLPPLPPQYRAPSPDSGPPSPRLILPHVRTGPAFLDPFASSPALFRRQTEDPALYRRRSYDVLQRFPRRHSDFGVLPYIPGERTGTSLWSQRRHSVFHPPVSTMHRGSSVPPTPLVPYTTGPESYAGPIGLYIGPRPSLSVGPPYTLPSPAPGLAPVPGPIYGTRRQPLLSHPTGPHTWSPSHLASSHPSARRLRSGDSPRRGREQAKPDHEERLHSRRSKSKPRSTRPKEPQTEHRRGAQSESRLDGLLHTKKDSASTISSAGEKTKSKVFPIWLPWKR